MRSCARAGPIATSGRPSCSSARSASSPGSCPAAQRSSALDIVTEIEWAKARDIEPDDYGAEAHALGRRAPLAYRDMARAYERYEHEKRQRRMIDFDDLLRLCRRDLREDRDFAQAQHWRYQHVFVDEFQDVNPLQRSLLDAWVAGRDDLCVVGDPNQAIYAWNGADPSAWPTSPPSTPAPRWCAWPTTTARARRSCAVANAVLAGGALDGDGDGAGRPVGTLHANRPDGPIPTITSCTDDIAEARAIARSLRDHHRPGGSWSTQAVLCRTNAQIAVHRAGPARHRHPVPGPRRGRSARSTRDQGGAPRPPTPRGRSARRTRRPAGRGPGARRRRARRCPRARPGPGIRRGGRRGAGRRRHRRRQPGGQPRGAGPARATTTWPSRVGRRPPASWPGSARRLAPTNPTSRATRSSWPPSTRPRGSSGRSSTWPGSSRASCPSATPAPPTTWPRSDACSTWRSPGPRQRCAARGPRAAPSVNAPPARTRSPYLDEVESACQRAAGRRRPRRLGGAPVGATGRAPRPRRRRRALRRGSTADRSGRRTGDRPRRPRPGRRSHLRGAQELAHPPGQGGRRPRLRDLPGPRAARAGARPGPGTGPACSAWRASARSRPTASATRSSPSWPSTRHPERVRFQIQQRFDASVDEVVGLFTDPAFYADARRATQDQHARGDRPPPLRATPCASTSASATPATCRRRRWP